MADEIEAKILEVDREATEERLKKLGAKRVSEETLRATYFSMPEGEMLRIRDEAGTPVLCYKKNASDGNVRTSEELETAVEDEEAMRTILARMGHPIHKRIEKRRITWDLDGTVVLFDQYLDADIPEFLEIEAQDVETVHAVAERLGFSADDLKPWTGKDVYKHYGQE